MTTDTQDLINDLRGIFIVDDISEAKARKIADKLEALQAEAAALRMHWETRANFEALQDEVARLEEESSNHRDAARYIGADRDAALARLAAMEAHHKEVLSDLDTRISYAESQRPTLEQFDTWWNGSKYMQVVFSDMNTRQVALDGWNASAGASPVEPSTDMKYTVALQRAIETHCKGECIPESVSELCPHHSKMLNDSLAQPSQAGSDLRGIDAGPLSEWIDLVKRGYVAKDECLIAVKDVPKWVAQNQPSQAGELSDEEILAIYDACNSGQHATLKQRFARAIIAAINAKEQSNG